MELSDVSEVKKISEVTTNVAAASVERLENKLEGLAYSAPPQPPLPDFRVSDDFAFSRIRVDFAGPVYVRDVYSRSKRSNKTYIAIFTCASSHAIHLEIVPDLSTSSFVRCFKRFIFRRGLPQFVISDNGKTFKGSSLKTFLMENGVTWKFNVPHAPWWGGFFELMVRSVKRCLKKTLGASRVAYEEFETTLVEVEGILNSWPLTYVTEDFEEPLTPSSLCIGRRLLSPTGNPQVVGAQGNLAPLSRRQRYLDTVLKHFWNRWRKEYLAELREHHRGVGGTTELECIDGGSSGSGVLLPSIWLRVNCLDTAGGAVSSDTEDVDSILSVD
ncbi:uncharacterized protein LOC110040534 [Orbicella faveolata]|uniref:uncharacterized protein LOC110040534 n=1 Tax=Orbicella faveolata TaxID=48498 RepID=UPI0009E1DC8F|nr:uncharacterized protein LOC110040534 [Orbicella faveolata]